MTTHVRIVKGVSRVWSISNAMFAHTPKKGPSAAPVADHSPAMTYSSATEHASLVLLGSMFHRQALRALRRHRTRGMGLIQRRRSFATTLHWLHNPPQP
ncbi:hypothetical protein WHR41_06034 [Cladosporium halotolerans]|uniref:Uncharacterized protein n=1 Tax=Cladosporium halotolerans TaxID=1052096 RepID=A0AB34KNH7_9PEZI